jgi:outer membrane protein TolC/outer membrane protein OmpA-like peptidoglycan-associated protein
MYASNQEFNRDIEKNLYKDFKKFGLVYNGETSVLTFTKSNILFENGKTGISKKMKIILDNFFPKYLGILMKHRRNIKKIIIKGHSSSSNRLGRTKDEKFELNRVLSQRRANNFLSYLKEIYEKNLTNNLDWIEEKFEAEGLSSSNLIYDANGNEDADASRRIEIEVEFYKTLRKVPSKSIVLQPQNKYGVQLSEYVRRLLIENPTLKEKYEVLKSFESEIRISQATFYPTVTLNFSHTQYSESTPDNFSTIQNKDITVRYNIFNGFKDLEDVNIQKYNHKTNEYLNEQIEGDLIYSLTEAFINLKKQKEILELSINNLLDYDLWKSKEDIKFQNGMVSLRNYAKVESRDTTQRMNHEELQKQYFDNISTFRRYLDFDEQKIPSFENLQPKNKYFEHKDIAFNDIKLFSPYLKEAKQNVIIYKEKLLKSKVNFYPTVNLVAKKSIRDENYETIATVSTEETSLGIEASMELYSGGKEKADNEKKLFEYRAKIEKKEEVLRDVKYRLELAFNTYELYLEKETLLKKLVMKREDSLLGATYDYKFAKIDANDLLDAVDDLYNAKKMYIENKYNKLTSKYKIFNTIGIIKNMILENELKE